MIADSLFPKRWATRAGWAAGVILLATSGFRCSRETPREDPAVKVPEGPGKSMRKKVEKLTGAATRVVWARDLGAGKDTFANGTQLVLMGLDTRAPEGERVLAAEPGNYSRPLFSPDGGQVIFTRRTATGDEKLPEWECDIFSVAWTGGAPQKIRKGYAVDLWLEPGTGKTWVYAFTSMRPGIGSNPEGYRLFRFPLTDPGTEEVVWEQGLMSGDNIQLNRSGTAASGLIPWPNAGTFDFQSGRFVRYRNGCWPSLAPDDSGVVWVFDGTHENLRVFLPGVEGNWRVPMEDAEGLNGKAAYHPRWSNHPRLVAFTGPHPVKVNQGHGKVSVILARFNESLTKFEKSVSLRNASGEPDCYPDVWVEGGGGVDLDRSKIGSKKIQELAAAGPVKPAAAWTPAADGLCFLWERADANNRIEAEKRESSVVPKRYARYGPRFDMLVEGGVFKVDEASAAAVRKAVATGPWSMEMAVTPLAAEHGVPQVILRAGPEFELQQSHHDFIVHVGGQDWQLGAGLSAGQTTHLAMGGTGRRGDPPVVWINGQSQEAQPVDTGLRPVLAPADSPEVQFGAREDGRAAWNGRLEHIAFHARPFDPVSAAAHAAWWREKLTGRVPPARTVVRARLKEASPRATPESIGAYRRSWTSALYEKTALLSGPDPGTLFGVAHWTILDGSAIPGPPGQPGEERELVLEPMTDHPEMDGEHGSEEILGDEHRLFLNAGPPGS